MLRSYKIAAILAVSLLIISVSINIINYKSSKRYEVAVDGALDYFFSNYKVGSINRSLHYVLDHKKIHFGEAGDAFNYFQRDFKELANMHRELTLLYGPIHSYNNYEKISSIGTDNIFDMFLDYSVFFEYLYDNNSESLDVEEEELYLSFNELEDEVIKGIEIITEITGELERIRSESYTNKNINVKDVLENYMIRSADYFNTQEVQEKIQVIESINKKLISQANI